MRPAISVANPSAGIPPLEVPGSRQEPADGQVEDGREDDPVHPELQGVLGRRVPAGVEAEEPPVLAHHVVVGPEAEEDQEDDASGQRRSGGGGARLRRASAG